MRVHKRVCHLHGQVIYHFKATSLVIKMVQTIRLWHRNWRYNQRQCPTWINIQIFKKLKLLTFKVEFYSTNINYFHYNDIFQRGRVNMIQSSRCVKSKPRFSVKKPPLYPHSSHTNATTRYNSFTLFCLEVQFTFSISQVGYIKMTPELWRWWLTHHFIQLELVILV